MCEEMKQNSRLFSPGETRTEQTKKTRGFFFFFFSQCLNFQYEWSHTTALTALSKTHSRVVNRRK